MTQHFLLSTKARTLSLAKVLRLSDDEAIEVFKSVRWADNEGEPYCPNCGCVALYEFKTRHVWKCKGCNREFSLTCPFRKPHPAGFALDCRIAA